MHRQHIGHIVVGHLGHLHHTIPQIRIINHMVRTNQPCQIEGLGRRIHRDSTVLCILGHALRRNMLRSRKHNV